MDTFSTYCIRQIDRDIGADDMKLWFSSTVV